MKKIQIFFVTCLVLGGLSVNAFAAELEHLTNSEDYPEVVARCEERIVRDMNELRGISDSTVTNVFTADQIDWSKAYAMYRDEADIFETFAEYEPTMQELKQELVRFWILPIRSDGINIDVFLDKGAPVDYSLQEEIVTEQGEAVWQQLLDDEGNWCPEAYMTSESNESEIETLINKTDAADGDEVIWLTGSARVRDALVIVDTESGVRAIPVREMSEEQSIVEKNLNGEQGEQKGLLTYQQPYTFMQAADVLENYEAFPKENENGEILYDGIDSGVRNSDESSIYVSISALLLTLAVGCGCFLCGIYRTRKITK